MEKTISVKQVFELLRKRLGLILIGGLLGLFLSGIIVFFILTPKYSSQTQLVVTLPQTENTNVNDVNTNLQMINTYKDIITGDLVTKEVAEKLTRSYGTDIEKEDLKKAIKVEQNQNSQMFSVIAVSTSPKEAMDISNVTAETFKSNAKNVLNVDRISIISKAVEDSTPIFPNKKLSLLIGALIGLIVGIFAAFVLEVLDRTIKDSQVITDQFGLTILGNVPQMTQKELNAKIRHNPVSTGTKATSATTIDRRRRNRV